jgi:hypothetical protein
MKKIGQALYYCRYHDANLTNTVREEEIQMRVDTVRSRYAAPATLHFLAGRRAFFSEDYPKARELLFRSIRRDPLNYQAWRFLAHICLDPRVTSGIRKIKHLIHSRSQ